MASIEVGTLQYAVYSGGKICVTSSCARFYVYLCQLINHMVFVKTGLNVLETRYFMIIHKIIHFLAKINHLTCGG